MIYIFRSGIYKMTEGSLHLYCVSRSDTLSQIMRNTIFRSLLHQKSHLSMNTQIVHGASYAIRIFEIRTIFSFLSRNRTKHKLTLMKAQLCLWTNPYHSGCSCGTALYACTYSRNCLHTILSHKLKDMCHT